MSDVINEVVEPIDEFVGEETFDEPIEEIEAEATIIEPEVEVTEKKGSFMPKIEEFGKTVGYNAAVMVLTGVAVKYTMKGVETGTKLIGRGAAAARDKFVGWRDDRKAKKALKATQKEADKLIEAETQVETEKTE